MSSFSFLASNTPLSEIKNPHIKYYSVNEALKKGIHISEIVLNSENIDKNQPNTVLWVDDEVNLGDLTICAFENDAQNNLCFTDLKYHASLEWKYSSKRAGQLISYIKSHLESSDKVELWHIWLDKSTMPRKYNLNVNDLTVEIIEKMFAKNSYDFPECMIITRI